MSFDITKDDISELFKEALQNKNIVVYYQPKFVALTNKIVGAEALSRWISPEGEIVPPMKFIPLLEENGMVIDLDWYVLEQVCEFLQGEIMAGRNIATISVNFSRVHTDEKKVAQKLVEITDKYKIPYDLIEIELTESAVAEDTQAVIRFATSIRELGFSVSIDDFGSGFSSLSLVKDIPANVLKIDKSLISENCENEKERVVLESIFSFARRLRMSTVAEGVETKEQLGFLRTCGCNSIQGFLFAKPMPQSDFVKLCNSGKGTEKNDILSVQSMCSANSMLQEVVMKKFPLILMINLSHNSYYMVTYENFATKSCHSTGEFDEMIVKAAETVYEADRQAFVDTYDRNAQLEAYKKGEENIVLTTRQLGDDGVYRYVETTYYFVKNPSSDDVLAVSLNEIKGVFEPCNDNNK